MDRLPIFLYYALFLLLSAHGLHRALLVWRVSRKGKRDLTGLHDPLERSDWELPVVTVQLPLYNEVYVAERLIRHSAALDWPCDKLEIQVLDDSTDDTCSKVAQVVRELAQAGHWISHIRRADRKGFKAGALAYGLRGGPEHSAAKGEFVAIFDADFIPPREFLRKTIPALVRDEQLAVVQARWDHSNRNHSLLTRLQAIFLDAHFAIEHEARQRAGHFLNFNGTAGVWRRSAIDKAGGWSHDTLTEDLDLSFRAQMAGMTFVYMHELGVPSELPVEMNAFKTQQHRWAKGSIETAIKLLPSLWQRKDIPLSTRLEGTFHLLNNFAYVIMTCVTVLALPVAVATSRNPAITLWLDRYLLGFGILPVLLYFLYGQLRVGQGFWKSLFLMPATLALGVGLSVNNCRAVLEALVGYRTAFIRTPKYHVDSKLDTWLGKRYLASAGLIPLIELTLGLCSALACILTIQNRCYGLSVFMAIFSWGYLYVGLASLMPSGMEKLRHRLARLGSVGEKVRRVSDIGTP